MAPLVVQKTIEMLTRLQSQGRLELESTGAAEAPVIVTASTGAWIVCGTCGRIHQPENFSAHYGDLHTCIELGALADLFIQGFTINGKDWLIQEIATDLYPFPAQCYTTLPYFSTHIASMFDQENYIYSRTVGEKSLEIFGKHVPAYPFTDYCILKSMMFPPFFDATLGLHKTSYRALRFLAGSPPIVSKTWIQTYHVLPGFWETFGALKPSAVAMLHRLRKISIYDRHRIFTQIAMDQGISATVYEEITAIFIMQEI